MVTTDKVISLGINAAYAAGYYSLYKTRMPAKALYSQLGGIAASGLFQTFYPECCHQMREKFGDNFTWTASWLYPGMIFLAGYIGGVPSDVNLLVTSSFFYMHSMMSTQLWDTADKRVSKEIEILLKDAKEKIEKKQLRAAGTAIEQTEDLSQRLTSKDGIHSWELRYIDDRKRELSKAYLSLTKPKFDEAEKWARATKAPEKKYTALQTLGISLLGEERKEETGVKIEGLVQECEKLHDKHNVALHTLDSFLTFKFAFAKKYEKTALLNEVRTCLSDLEQSDQDIYVLFKLAKNGAEQGDKEFTKHCIALAESRIAKFEETKGFAWSSWRHFSLTSLKGIEGPEYFCPLRGSGSIKSKMVYAFIGIARAIGDIEATMRFFKTDMLEREDRIAVEMETAQMKFLGAPEESRASVTRALELIRAYTLPEDVEEREIQIAKYHKEAFLVVVTYQMDFDVEGAYQTAQDVLPNHCGLQLSIADKAQKTHVELSRRIVSDVEAQFAELSFARRLDLMRLQLIVAPETLFTSYERHEATWKTATPIEQAKALLCLAEGHLSRNASGSAKPLLARAEALGAKSDEVQEKLSRLRNWNSPLYAQLF